MVMETIADDSKKIISQISNFRDKNEKASWIRKKKTIEKIVEDIKPIEEQILILSDKKIKMIEEIQEIRKTMISECIHPSDYIVKLSEGDNTKFKCKFCNNIIKIK